MLKIQEAEMVVVCGEGLIDMVPTQCGGSQGYVPRPGGSPLNVAIGLARLDVPVAFLGRLSRDRFGRRLVQHLHDNAVELRYLRDGPEVSSLAFVHNEPGQEAQYAFYSENSADRNLLPTDLPDRFEDDVNALHFGSISLMREPSASTLELCMRREHGARLVTLDPNVRAQLIADADRYRRRLDGWIRMSDLVKVSRADLQWLYPARSIEQVAQRWRGLGACVVVVTLGIDGAVAFGPGATATQPAFPVPVTDTVGAGDAFMAGALAWLHHASLLDRTALTGITTGELTALLGYANQVSALTCTRAGADPPRLDELADFPLERGGFAT
jgi:fructokinase